ncbi:hypothetical protein [Pseudolactococcus insecticola]|uniref:Uncharacterized protein n=1 Tax=Pseudolactococcus insecticola TaxID=2709158 RepID=A0A6A0B8T2_9LACT|nr:hypothetical protein [Lactococcus insecticola]GFH40851.1 hypothetical protein Hs20B_12490 [Lactococcus insecticola]
MQELKLYMQMATSDVICYPNSPRVHIYLDDEELGTLLMTGEPLDDFGEAILACAQKALSERYEEIMNDWNAVQKENLV